MKRGEKSPLFLLFSKKFKKMLDLDVELVYTVLVPTNERDKQKAKSVS